MEFRIVDKQNFLHEYASLKAVINGKGKQISREAGVAYHTYRNAVAGKVNNPAVLGSILRACKIVYYRIIEQYANPSPDGGHRNVY